MNTQLSDDAQKKPLDRGELMRVRGLCLLRGTTLSAWFDANGFSRNSSFNAALGRRNGPVSRKIRAAVRAEFGL